MSIDIWASDRLMQLLDKGLRQVSSSQGFEAHNRITLGCQTAPSKYDSAHNDLDTAPRRRHIYLQLN